MGRSIKQIQDSIIAAKDADANLSSRLTSASRVAIWLLWTYIVAFCQWVLENFFDEHKSEVEQIIATQRPHTVNWYVQKAKAFQYGDALPLDSDVYATINPDNQIVKYAAGIEAVPHLRLLLATLNGGVLAPLNDAQVTAFKAYMALIKDSGVRLDITSNAPDDLQCSFAIYYDALVIAADGSRLDGTAATPVLDAVKAFIIDLPFNGLFVVNELIDAIEAVDGVEICEVTTMQARYGLIDFVPFAVEYRPDAGYLLLDEAYTTTNTTYTPHIPI